VGVNITFVDYVTPVPAVWLNYVNSVVNSGTTVATQQTIAGLRTVSQTANSYVLVTGYYANDDGGGGLYTLNPNDTTSVDNGGSIIVANDGGRWYLNQQGPQTVIQFGAKGDGVTNDTTAIQNCINANVGNKIIIPAGRNYLCAGITLSGPTYNNTTIQCDGTLLLQPDDDNSTFGGAWVGILLENCSNINLNPKWNGNNTNMTEREQIFCVGIAGASNITIPTLDVTNIRGDGLYIGQSSWTSQGTVPSSIRIGRVTAINSTDDGRNAVSVISVSGLDIDEIISYHVGGIINGVVEPGGLDIEPDYGYETCNNIHVGYLDVLTAGAQGVGIVGKSISGNDANRDWNVFDVRIDNYKLLFTGTSGASVAGSAFTRCADVQVRGFVEYNTTAGRGIILDYAQRIVANWTFENVTQGLWIGPSNLVTDFTVTIQASQFTDSGLKVSNVQRGQFWGRCWGSSGGSAVGIRCNNNGNSVTQISVSYMIDASYDGNMTYAFQNDPSNLVTFGSGCRVQACDYSGYSGPAINAMIARDRVLGVSYAAANPGAGGWSLGDFVWNSAPASAANKTTLGWTRLNTGNNNVLGTDWVAVIGTNT
jgi:hypothetical protein